MIQIYINIYIIYIYEKNIYVYGAVRLNGPLEKTIVPDHFLSTRAGWIARWFAGQLAGSLLAGQLAGQSSSYQEVPHELIENERTLILDDCWISRTVIFLYLATLYLAEAVIKMPSPRNHILGFVNLAPALSGNGQSAKSKLFTTITSLVPNFKVRPLLAPIASSIPKKRNPKFGRGSGRVLNFASYH